MREPGFTPSVESKGDPTTVIFLGLYLLLLAFFMLLNSIAEINGERADDVVNSVGKAFSAFEPPKLTAEQELVAKGGILETDTFQGQVKAAMISVLRVAEVESLGGEQMRIESHVEDLFQSDGETLRKDASEFLDRIAQVVTRDERGKTREIEIIIGVGETLPETVDAGSSQRLRQVALFASGLMAREVPPDVVSIGLSPGEDGNIVMFLTLRETDDPEADSAPESTPESGSTEVGAP